MVVGRAANFVVSDLKNTFHARVVGSHERRVEYTARRYGVSLGRARDIVKKTDKERKKFVQRYAHAKIGDPQFYHLVLNTDDLTIDGAARILADSMLDWAHEKTKWPGGTIIYPMKKTLEQAVIAEAVQRRATDIHIDPLLNGYSVRFRVDGSLLPWKNLEKRRGERSCSIKSNLMLESSPVRFFIRGLSGARWSWREDGWICGCRWFPVSADPRWRSGFWTPEEFRNACRHWALEMMNRRSWRGGWEI